MKKVLATIVVAVALGAQAAWEKIGTVQVADVTSLVGGVTKLGEFTGNAMLGLMASSSISSMPCVSLFGPGRAGVPFAISLLWDGEDMECAFLYPIDQTQAEFLKLHPGKVGKDGVIKLDADEGVEDADDRYVLFSKDGKWVAFSDKKDQLALALKDVKLASSAMQRDLVRVFIGSSGKAVLLKIIDDAAKETAKANAAKKGGDPGFAKLKDVIAGFSSCVLGIGVDDKGLSVRGTAKTVKGSKVAACGLKTLAANPLAFAGKDALFVSAVAADCGMDYFNTADILAVLKKHGIKTDWLAIDEGKGNVTRITLDIPGAVAYFKRAEKELKAVDWEKVGNELKAISGGRGDAFVVENPAMSTSFAIKGYTSPATPAERLATVLPEVAGKPLFQVQSWSLYALVKAVLPHLLSAMEPQERAMFQSLLATLPPEGKGGIASAYWREGETHKFLFRASADEFKCVSAGFAAFSAYQMQQQAKAAKAQNSKRTTTKSKTKAK